MQGLNAEYRIKILFLQINCSEKTILITIPMTLRSVLASIILLLFATILYGQPEISTKVSSKKIALDEILSVTYSCKDRDNRIEYRIPDYDDFVQVGMSQSMESNGTQSITVLLKPTRTGTFSIPGIGVVIAPGKVYYSKSVTVEVIPATGKSKSVQPNTSTPQYAHPLNQFDQHFKRMDDQMRLLELYAQLHQIEFYLQLGNLSDAEVRKLKKYHREVTQAIRELEQELNDPSRFFPPEMQQQHLPGAENNFFIRAVPSKRKAYVNEPIEIEYRIYFTTPFSNGEIKKWPQLSDFVTHDYPLNSSPKPRLAEYQGKSYSCVTVKKCVAYPTKPGILKIDPLAISAFTDRFGRIIAESPVENIEVIPLPPHNNTHFTGAVGKFAVRTSLSPTSITTSDIAKFTLTVGGQGNFDLFTAPKLPDLGESIVMTSPQTLTKRDSNNVIQGSKSFVYEFSVSDPGDFEIPAIPFTYFDPESKQYVTLYTEPIRFTVEQGDVSSPWVNSSDTASIPLLARAENYGEIPRSLNGSGIWVPLALLAALVAVPIFSRGKQMVEEQKQQRIATADYIAKQRLHKAKQLMGLQDSALFYEEISKSIWLFLSERLNIAASDLTKAQLDEKMKQVGIESMLRDEVQWLIRETEMALYARTETDLSQKKLVLERAEKLLIALEKQFKVA